MNEQRNGASKVAYIILALVGLANWGYAAYRMANGKEDNLALIIAGLTSLVIALAIFQQSRSGSDET